MKKLIKYSELIEYALTYISSVCENIDVMKPSIPDDVKNGYTRVLANNGKHSITMVVSDGTVAQVASSTVRSELTSFLSTQGVYSKAGTLINAKGVLNFFNYLASFISGHVFTVVNNVSGNKCCVYKAGAVSVSGVARLSEEIDSDPERHNVIFTATHNENNLASLTEALKNVTSVKSINTLINYACSSSSSSSSSSCSCSSSSSCCSSSSSYIVYMMI